MTAAATSSAAIFAVTLAAVWVAGGYFLDACCPPPLWSFGQSAIRCLLCLHRKQYKLWTKTDITANAGLPPNTTTVQTRVPKSPRRAPVANQNLFAPLRRFWGEFSNVQQYVISARSSRRLRYSGVDPAVIGIMYFYYVTRRRGSPHELSR
ncbi:uncharacterized protein LOC118647644 isoform X1 [Monomorium pharaonis]|uniref:uncharacterized protein LOC118647643 isoform X1 n=1 Tax=Monomorium pharaonis TaxID=307658 RepID=UPI0017478672|nr:uncharacterized protein LOC118647643 isoform X1 [Monomorium pharaonis]XP_036148805.1 uncharacterized protein LOC118647643 isoform X1 [Monomorium pharaonis]XP_036148808.1 uncharacterized protein LOC118647644 isoform X1 [Monomorium pharaonis]